MKQNSRITPRLIRFRDALRLVKRGRIWHIDNLIGKKHIQSSIETRCLEEAEGIPRHLEMPCSPEFQDSD